jgi:competence protein ComGC
MLNAASQRCRRGQWTLVGTLVAIAIIFIMMAIYMPRIAARHSAKGQPRTPMERAYGAGCDEYLGQINMAVTMYRDDHHGSVPNSLDDLKNYGIDDNIVHAQGCAFTLQNGVVTETANGTAPDYHAPPAAPAPAAPQSAPGQPVYMAPPGAQAGPQPAQAAQPAAGTPSGGGDTRAVAGPYGIHIPSSVTGGGADAGGAGGY